MKTKIVLMGIFAILISSCNSQKYLPSAENIDINQNGSYIKVFCKMAEDVDGELIAIDTGKIVVLSESKCITVPINDVKRFKLRYAKPKHYGWTIPLYALATISHGLFLMITAPLNLIVTISVTISGENTFKYNNKNMTYDKLKMFARFPQGIPDAINIESIE